MENHPDYDRPPPPLTPSEVAALHTLAYACAALAESGTAPGVAAALRGGGVTGRLALASGLDLTSIVRMRLTSARRLLAVDDRGPDPDDDDDDGPPPLPPVRPAPRPRASKPPIPHPAPHAGRLRAGVRK